MFFKKHTMKVDNHEYCRERLDIALDAQLHMDIDDTTREMQREGFFKYGIRDSKSTCG